jgi:hypothetical protein
MTNERLNTTLVVIALLGAILSFVIPLPWGAIPAAITLLIAIPLLVLSRRKRG